MQDNLNENEKEFLNILNKGLIKEENLTRVIDKEMVDNLFKTADLMVNNFSFRPEELCEMIIADSMSRCYMLYISLYWIARWATVEDYYVDGRNETPVSLCKQLYNLGEFRGLCENYDVSINIDEKMANIYCDIGRIFSEKSLNMHKTLMSTLSNLIFCFISKSPYTQCREINKTMTKEYYKDWYRMPLV